MGGHAGHQHRVHHLLQMAAGNGGTAVPLVNHLALFCDADTAVYRAGRLGQNRPVGRAAAAGNRAAAPVKQRHRHAMLAADRRQRFLRLVQFPVGRQITGILVAV